MLQARRPPPRDEGVRTGEAVLAAKRAESMQKTIPTWWLRGRSWRLRNCRLRLRRTRAIRAVFRSRSEVTMRRSCSSRPKGRCNCAAFDARTAEDNLKVPRSWNKHPSSRIGRVQLRGQYKSVADDLMKAQAGAELVASERRGERLSLVEPADRRQPNWPMAVADCGWRACGRGAGLLLALIVEI